jgi:hypothetical protein
LALERDPERAAERGDCPLYDSKKAAGAKRLAADDRPT